MTKTLQPCAPKASWVSCTPSGMGRRQICLGDSEALEHLLTWRSTAMTDTDAVMSARRRHQSKREHPGAPMATATPTATPSTPRATLTTGSRRNARAYYGMGRRRRLWPDPTAGMAAGNQFCCGLSPSTPPQAAPALRWLAQSIPLPRPTSRGQHARRCVLLISLRTTQPSCSGASGPSRSLQYRSSELKGWLFRATPKLAKIAVKHGPPGPSATRTVH